MLQFKTYQIGMMFVLLISTQSAFSNSSRQSLDPRLKRSAINIKNAPAHLTKKIDSLYKWSEGDFIDDRESKDEIILFAKMRLIDHYETVLYIAQGKNREKTIKALSTIINTEKLEKIKNAIKTINPKHDEFYRHDSIEVFAEQFAKEDLKEVIRIANEEVTPMLKEKSVKVTQLIQEKRKANKKLD